MLNRESAPRTTGSPTGNAPILVTGVPRSGTTWLGRLLALAPGTSLPGREPMNPRGRQYALGHTVDGWARLEELSGKQRRALRSAYAGLNPYVYSRYGSRRWAGPLPWSRKIVKDPFAMLSVPVVAECTGAIPVLVYRHPGAVLVSYQRMGWNPDLEELGAVRRAITERHGTKLPELPARTVSPAEAMAMFWTMLHSVALPDLSRVPGAQVVDHAELATSGAEGGRRLFTELGLSWCDAAEAELTRMARDQGPVGEDSRGQTLHELGRSPAAVAGAWRERLGDDDMRVLDDLAGETLASLDSARLALGRRPSSPSASEPGA
ncbi:sulfotransferase [Isoptericola jiangsuensis]|uniref:sulfotransferase n=1 Tax=Isoptericola jiangsuensis TaxID=548579 RepID=UPI003AADB443